MIFSIFEKRISDFKPKPSGNTGLESYLFPLFCNEEALITFDGMLFKPLPVGL